jgi:hypothetical protein
MTVASEVEVTCFMAEAVNDVTMPVVGIWCRYGGAAGKIQRLADTLMDIPGAPTPGTKFQYVDYPQLSPDGTVVVFQGNDQQGRRGVYSAAVGGGGVLKKVVDWQDEVVTGTTIFNIQLNFGSFDGVYVSFFLALADGNEGIYATSIY